LKSEGVVEKPSVSKTIKLIGDFDKTQRAPVQDRRAMIKRNATLLREKTNIPYADAKYFIKMYGDRAFDIFKLDGQEKLHPSLPHTVGIIFISVYR
jgi:hypothetical protein